VALANPRRGQVARNRISSGSTIIQIASASIESTAVVVVSAVDVGIAKVANARALDRDRQVVVAGEQAVVVEAKPLAARSADACASRHSRLLPDGSEGGVGSAPLPAAAQCMPDWGRKRLRAWLLSEVGGGGIDFVPAHFATPLALVREEVSELRAVRRPDGAAAGAEDDERCARRSNRLRHAITLRDTAQPGSRTKPHFGRGNYGRLRRAAGAERRQHRTADACRLDRRPLRRVRIRSADHHRRNLALDRGRTAGLADARARGSRRAGQRHTSIGSGNRV
jgi:hypothetical protein